jgi:hypothetical protein
VVGQAEAVVTPVDTPWHFTTGLDSLDHWQTIIAGVLAFVAGFGTVVATMVIARRQIAASREEADRVIAASSAQTEATFKQIEATVRLEEMRDANEALAFHAMLEAAMARVLAEAAWARITHPQNLTEKAGASPEALAVRKCITKGGFAELRAACVRKGGPLTGELLDLEREIDSFAGQWEDRRSTTMPVTTRMGLHAGLGAPLALIETNATKLQQKAFQRFI